ncbi:tetratricopeptide repeat protein [Pyrinomonas methylaliphatogenes]|uniref:DNA-binding protein with winged-HTH domain n=1 Tax=Pyrinomonas methylaliphatogenes TaxID=454194 RepID=A0A0B6WYS6_9BACT|nr:tetratricopeptide repeat protein [Pyrinomonas methylaliphatogenes]CDM65449.1 DNA-binding protein with winged-HTH domain [Pyrinomonas methylaliphatogenes]
MPRTTAPTNLNEDIVYEFGPFRLNARERILWRDDRLVPLAPKAIETLLALIERRGHVVSREELMARVWSEAFVEEANLTVQISVLRKTLGDTAEAPRYIETVAKRGYRFIAEVKVHRGEEADEAAQASVEALASVHPHEEAQPEAAPHVPQESTSAASSPRWLNNRALAGIAILALLFLAAIVITFSPRWSSGDLRLRVRSLAVLPFQVMPETEEAGFLSLGVADGIINKLSQYKELAVRPTTAIGRYNPPQDAVAVGRELGVEAVLTGTVQRVGDQWRVSVQLIDAKENRPLWAAKFDERKSDLLLLQDSIAQRVASALAMALVQPHGREDTTNTNNNEALQEYLKGRYFWNRRTRESLYKSIEHFRRAVELDPNYALAYVGLADCYNLLSLYSVPPAETFPKAKEAALKALELDPQSAEAHTSLAYALFRYDWDWQGAEREFRYAIELNPNYATAHHWYAEFLAAMGRFDEALAEIERARALDPLSLPINTDVGEIFYYWRRFDEAERAYKRALELDASFVRAHFEMGRLYEVKGMYDEALREYELARSFAQGRFAERSAGQAGEWRAVWSNMIASATKSRAQGEYVYGYSAALCCLRLGDAECAIEWLTHAYRNRDPSLPFIAVDPLFDPLRSDPRFISLVEAMRLDRAH